jgi:hypothetical protein
MISRSLRTLATIATLCFACEDPSDPAPEPIRLQVTVHNISMPGQLVTSMGAVDILLSPGVWATHAADTELFSLGTAASAALEQLAEDGAHEALLAEARALSGVALADTFGVERPGENYRDNPISPGESASFEVSTRTDRRLSLAMMFVHSNDVILATDPGGLGLRDDVALENAELALFDVGTEQNEEPGAGPNQPMQQDAPGSGVVEGGSIARVDDPAYPAVDTFVQVSLQRLE